METIEQMNARHELERARFMHTGNSQLQRDPQIEEDARELLKPLSFDFDAPIQWRGQPEINAAPPPSFQHPSLRDFIKHATTHPGTDGVSEVKRMLGKPFNAIQLTADHDFDNGGNSLPAGSWLFEMSTMDGGKMWVSFLNETVQNEYRELSEDTASEHVNARMFAVLAQLFPGATLAQVENAVADGKYIAVQQKDWARVNDDAQRMKAVAENLARELEITRPIVDMLKKLHSTLEWAKGYDQTLTGLVQQAVQSGY